MPEGISQNMKQATTRRTDAQPSSIQLSRRLREGAFILLCSLAIYLLIALITYHESDPAWSHAGNLGPIHNAAGKTGAWIADVLFSIFGYIAYIFPLVLAFSGIFVYHDGPVRQSNPLMWTVRTLGVLIALMASCGLASMLIHQTTVLPMNSGGLLGETIKRGMIAYLNPVGSGVLLIAFFLTGITLFTGLSWLQVLDWVGHGAFMVLGKLRSQFKKLWQNGSPSFPQLPAMLGKLKRLVQLPKGKSLVPEMPTTSKKETAFFLGEVPKPFLQENAPAEKFEPLFAEPKAVKKMKAKEVLEPKPKMTVKKSSHEEDFAPAYQPKSHAAPSLGLLEAPEKVAKQGFSSSQLQDLSRLVETRLLEFGVDAKVVGVQPGPVITRFELDLAAGIKVNKITTLAKDLARSLSVVSVRVVEVIPGKSVVGLEIPNSHRELVRLKEVLEDSAYQQAPSPLSLALGKDISGRPVVVDLAKMPHLLVAGTTGSGKSVGVNAMLLSILYKASPEEVRMILIDPKMLELAVYDNIPHLLTPVVTDMKDAANALRWCVAEMERRYQLMAACGVRNLAGYNTKVENAAKEGNPLRDPFWQAQANSDEAPAVLEKLPLIVVVVDEFADMMMVVGKKVEELIARIAQKARAAGIHLILATQRPSVDVITGLIKANIPTRIAFQVSSRIDSRTILDQSGAEQLLGHGDMLYLPPGVGVPHRIHGAFVSDDEVHKVTQQLRKLGKPTYIESVVQSQPSASLFSSEEETDELYDQAIAVVAQERKASISLVQRRLKIGYNRAARLIEQMESDGIVSSVQSNGTREVLAPPMVED